MLNINPYLERFIFDELKAQYDPDPIAALHNLDNNEQQSQRYLGTYFPRSFVESYNIFYRLFNRGNFITTLFTIIQRRISFDAERKPFF